MQSAEARQILAAYGDRFAAARRAQAAGQPVVGIVSTNVPVELIEAAGCLPVLVTGSPGAPTPRADEWMEEQFDPIVRSVFEQALAGELEFLDLLVVPRTADSLLRLYLYLHEVQRLGVANRLPPLQLLDLLQTPWHTTQRYNLARMAALRGTLARLSGRAVDDAAVAAAVDLSNRDRAAWRAAFGRDGAAPGQRRHPWTLALAAAGARYFMPVEEHLRCLQGLAQAAPPLAAEHFPVLVAGNAQDHTGLHHALERAGFEVVGDHHWMGDYGLLSDLPVTTPAIVGLSEHYQMQHLSSRKFPASVEPLVRHVRSSGAAAVVFYLFREEEALAWDIPMQLQALQQLGIEALVLRDRAYAIEPDTHAALAAFRARLGRTPEAGA